MLTAADSPTAVFTAQNFVSIGALRALHELELHRRIAHVGFDDVELADLLEPGLTVVPQNPRLIGQLAAQRLFARLAGATTPPQVVRLPTALIERGSGEMPPPSR